MFTRRAFLRGILATAALRWAPLRMVEPAVESWEVRQRGTPLAEFTRFVNATSGEPWLRSPEELIAEATKNVET